MDIHLQRHEYEFSNVCPGDGARNSALVEDDGQTG